MKTGQKILIAIFIILWLFIAFYLPYLIHFKWNFFGSNFVTMRDILGLWIGLPLGSFVFLLALLVFIIDVTKKI